jgi:hypothetical protein
MPVLISLILQANGQLHPYLRNYNYTSPTTEAPTERQRKRIYIY